jgi:hypothetical protein
MLGLDAAGKTSEFLSCPVQSGRWSRYNGEHMEYTQLARCKKWMRMEIEPVSRGLYLFTSTPLLQFVHPSLSSSFPYIFSRFQEQD